ncbi:MAG: GNAT family N-acetyltransferase, partial [Thermomicrobiales bacterium]|nr:GNAT family N-acetyltransferase [Thermomicrobiales bacterium]
MPPRLIVLPQDRLTPTQRAEIVALCDAAFAEPFAWLFDLLPGATHLLAREGKRLVGHACWVERWLYPEEGSPLRSAYVEAVATLPARQGGGIGTAMMRQVAAEIAA